MAIILGSVGRGGTNNQDDVTAVQELLNRRITELSPLRPAFVTGRCDEQTILLIEEFQRRVVKLDRPDGRVDPRGRTFAALTAAPGPAPAPAVEPILVGHPLPLPAAKVLKGILKALGLPRAQITSVSRTVGDQARVMYENCVAKGAEFNKRMYAAAGDKVVDVFTANQDKPRAEVIELMRKKIVEVGPGHVSKHISDTHYTFDVAPSSIPAAQHAAFVKALRAHKAVTKVIPPPVDPAFHIEIPKNSPHL
jgi:hypothetical protein